MEDESYKSGMYFCRELFIEGDYERSIDESEWHERECRIQVIPENR